MMRYAMIALVLVAALSAVLVVGCTNKESAETPSATAPGEPAHATQTTEGTEAPAGDFTYVCPMHPEETADKPGKCPKCGMYMEADTDEEVEYWCPMHPDVVQNEPGECEQCNGMPLPARAKQ